MVDDVEKDEGDNAATESEGRRDRNKSFGQILLAPWRRQALSPALVTVGCSGPLCFLTVTCGVVSDAEMNS